MIRSTLATCDTKPIDSIAFTPLIVSYTVEILPYSIRAKGFTIFNFSVSLSLIFNQYVNPIALAKLGWKYYVCVFPLSVTTYRPAYVNANRSSTFAGSPLNSYTATYSSSRRRTALLRRLRPCSTERRHLSRLLTRLLFTPALQRTYAMTRTRRLLTALRMASQEFSRAIMNDCTGTSCLRLCIR